MAISAIIAVAAFHVVTTEAEPWRGSAIESVSDAQGEVLFETDGATPREGSVPWRAWGTTFNELDLDALRLLKPEEQDEVMRRLFAPDGDMMFTRGRLVMNANDYSRAWYSCSETEGDFDLKDFSIEHDKTNQITLVKMAQKYNPDLAFWMSPWSPPAWMKRNKDYCVMSSKFNNQPAEKDGLIYGGVRDEKSDPNEMWLQGDRRKLFPRRLATSDLFIMEEPYLKAYADMFVRFVELYRAEGVPIDMVMYQNEAYSYTPYPGCAWTKEGTVRFNRDYLAPALKAKCPGVKLYLGTINTNRREYILDIIEAEGVLDCIDGFGFQWEGREVMESITDKYSGKHRICSESECGNGQMDWRAAEHTAWLIFRNMAHGADEWYNWNFILCDQGRSPWGWKQNALVRVRSANRTFEYRPEYYAVKHFAHFIKPGAMQLAYRPEENRDGIEAVCYKNPDGSVVVVAGNFSNEEKPVSFAIAGKTYSLVLAPHSFNTIVERPQHSYVMVYHKDADHGLHMAVSDDSYNWRAVNGDKPIVDITDVALQKGIRDPFIGCTPDGTYIVAMTDLHVFAQREGLRETEWERPFELYDWGNNRGLVILTSRDLVNWQKHYINFTEIPGFENVGSVVAIPDLLAEEIEKAYSK